MDNKDFHIGVRCTRLAREYTKQHLAQHGWNISDAYNRLSVGKGLLSSTDKKALVLYRQCLIELRHCGMPTIENENNIPVLADWYRKQLNPWRKKVTQYIKNEIVQLEAGKQPKYLDQLRAFTKRKVTTKDLDTYYLLKIKGEKDTDKIDGIIEAFLSKKPEQLALYASTVDKDHPKVIYDSRYTIRCRLNKLPSFGETDEVDTAFSKFARSILNYIYDIPSQADRHLIAFLKDNLKGLKTLRTHLATIAKSPEMDETMMNNTIKSLDIELEVFAWPV